MDNNALNIIITIVVVIAFIFIYLRLFTSFFQNFSTSTYEKSVVIKKQYTPETLRLLKKICYQFRHRSFDAWLAWLRIQETDIQSLALNKLIQHLNADVVDWDESLTPDIITSLTVFKGIKNLSFIFPNLLQKIKESTHTTLVNRFLFYKSTFIPFVTLYPSLALEYLEMEVEELKNSDELGSFDRKKFIIDQLKRINNFFNEGKIYNQTIIDILLEIICNHEEDSMVRWEAFEVLIEFDPLEVNQASLKILPAIIDHSETIDDVVSQIFKGLTKDLVSSINKPEIFAIYKNAMQKNNLKQIIVATFGNLLMGLNSIFNIEHLFAIHKMDDERDHELTNILCKRNTLTESEMTYVSEKVPKYLDVNDLMKAEGLFLDDLPIPIFQKDYFDALLKKVGRVPFERKETSINQNVYESALLRGLNKFDKIYVIRLFCILRNMDFKHIDFEEIVNSNRNDMATALENRLKYEPEGTLLYLTGVDHIYGKDHNDDEYRKNIKKVKQVLKVFSQNKDYFLVAASEDTSLMQESGPVFIDIQADNIFKNIVDFVYPGQYDMLKVLESIVNLMNKKRIRDGEAIVNQILKIARDKSMIEGYYLAGRVVKMMLILFPRYESLEPIFNLEEKYEFLINEAKKKASAQQKSK
ncbi:MAG: hypothetical protein KGO93_03125 [Cyanobacteria bacterium REEB446]|nr:hypothetical protein [Cyanobacteria bacterium REEB446]